MITDDSIRRDVEGFRAKIINTQTKLAALPVAATYKTRLKLAAQRKALHDEIRHVEHLTRIAEEALTSD